MDHSQLQFDLEHAPSVRLLKRANAPLIISFLYRSFKQQQAVSVPLGDLSERLDAYLEALNEAQPGSYPLAPAAYLKQWADEEHRLLRIITRGDDATVELTADAERVLGWVEELYRREFVGTESRLRSIVQLLDEIVVRSSEDVEARLAQLERDRDAIQAEIETIRATGEVIPYTSTQIKERFLQASELARQMYRDFAEVEQNFRGIARSVQERQLQPGARKGALVGYVLDADAELRESDQGRSFYAFWEFLMSPSRQDELAALLDTVYHLPALAEMHGGHPLLRRLSRALIDSGEKIVASNHRLAEQVRRLLDDRTLAESRRARELVADIKQLALLRAETPPQHAAFVTLEGPPEVALPMEKQLWEPRAVVAINTAPLEIGLADLDDGRLDALYDQFYVDESRLQRQIDTLLEQRERCTLGEVLDQYPAYQGLAEIIAYLAIAARDERHLIEGDANEDVALPSGDAPPRLLRVPRTVFHSSYARVQEKGRLSIED